MRFRMILALPVLATLVAGSAVGEERFRLVPTERPTPRSCIEVEMRGEGKVVAFYDEHGTIVKEIKLELPCNYPVVSKNRQNVVIKEPVGECDIMAHYRLHLYDAKGILAATSEPMMLYDLYVEPMGNNSTVLVIYPAVEVPVFSIAFLQAEGGALSIVANFWEERGNPLWDVGLDGQHCVIAMNASSEENKAEVVLLRSDGAVIWRVALDESTINGPLLVSPRSGYVLACSRASGPRSSYAYMLSIEGQRLWKSTIETEAASFSRDENEALLALATSSGEIRLLTTESGRRIVSQVEEDTSLWIKACSILPDQSVAAVLVKKHRPYDEPTAPNYVAVMDSIGGYQRMWLSESRRGPTLHLIGGGAFLEFAPPDIPQWFQIRERDQ